MMNNLPERNLLSLAVNPRIDLEISPTITPDRIQAVLERIYKLAGCPACGLGGFDVRLNVIQPELAELRQIEGIHNVTLNRG
jgi:hypothetical protein